VRALAGEKQITVSVETSGDPLVIGDSTWLDHAALILVDNAIKYNRPGGAVTIHAALDQANAVLEVRDTGVGISAEHLPHLGERFYRVDKARSRALGGAGLGLAIARGIAVAHGGSLSFTSEPDVGTTATLRLPAANPATGA
jgi:signal transduction histidine kinase